MKKAILPILLICLMCLTGCQSDKQIQISATNPLDIYRTDETIEVDLKKLSITVPYQWIEVYYQTPEVSLTSQLIDLDQDGKFDQLVFQDNFNPNETRTYTLVPKNTAPPNVESLVVARYTPERMDDFAWENDRIGFRMYGKALEVELVSSGIDVFCKRTREPVMEKWLTTDVNYHKDTGEGLDLYKVDETRGCGGTAFYYNGKLIGSRNYTDYKIIANGPVRTVFELVYEPWKVGQTEVSETKRITLDKGHNLNFAENRIHISGNDSLYYAIGIAMHANIQGALTLYKSKRWMSRWEDYKNNGKLGCAVIVPEGKPVNFMSPNNHHLALITVKSGETVKYYFGAGWDKSGDFKNEIAWNEYLAFYKQKIHTPIQISIK